MEEQYLLWNLGRIKNQKNEMNNFRLYISLIIFISTIILSDVKAQVKNNFELLQEISVDNIKIKNNTHQNSQIKIRRNIKHKKQSQLNLNDSTLNLFDVDIDLALGDISLDATWGDPVVSPQIRCNKASNLFGPVRHNADGSIRWHRGFDYYAPKGTPIMAVGEGVISLIQENHPGYGLCILITHKRPKKTYYSFYAHLSSVSVKYGQKVQRGTVIGRSGTTGNANNLSGKEEHLHFEYRTSPKHGAKKQANPNAILKTKFYSADPKNKWQSNVNVVRSNSLSF